MSEDNQKVPETIRISPYEAFQVWFPSGARVGRIGARWNGMAEIIFDDAQSPQTMIIDEPSGLEIAFARAFGSVAKPLDVRVIKASPQIFAWMLEKQP